MARTIVEQVEPGYGGALVTGFAHASGDVPPDDGCRPVAPAGIRRAPLERARRADVTIASRYVDGRQRADGRVSLHAQPNPECVLLARAGRPDSRFVQRISTVPQRDAPRTAHHEPRFRRPAANPRPGVRRGLARSRDPLRLPAARARRARMRACCASAWRSCARSASSGSSATRSWPPTTTTARTTAGSCCSATGSDRVIAT